MARQLVAQQYSPLVCKPKLPKAGDRVLCNHRQARFGQNAAVHSIEILDMRQRTVVDDVPRLRDKAAGLSGKAVIARARRAKGVATQLREAKLRLQIVGRQCCQRASQAMTCAQLPGSADEVHGTGTSDNRFTVTAAAKVGGIDTAHGHQHVRLGNEQWGQHDRHPQTCGRPVTMTRKLARSAGLRLFTMSRTWASTRWSRPLQCHDAKKPRCTRGAREVRLLLSVST